jgi:hypothetical protein
VSEPIAQHPEAGTFAAGIIVNLREEILRRLRTADEIVGLYLAAAGAVGAFALGSPVEDAARQALLLLLIPALAVPASTLIYQQQLVIGAIVEFLVTDIAYWARENGFDVPVWEQSPAWRKLRRESVRNLRILYVLVIPGPAILAALLAALAARDWLLTAAQDTWPGLLRAAVLAAATVFALGVTLWRARASWRLWRAPERE